MKPEDSSKEVKWSFSVPAMQIEYTHTIRFTDKTYKVTSNTTNFSFTKDGILLNAAGKYTIEIEEVK